MPLSESAITKRLSLYGADRLGCELHERVAALMFGVPTAALRFLNVYGPRQDPNSPYSGVIALFSKCLTLAKPSTIFTSGEQYRDFINMTNVVNFLRRAMRKNTKPTFEN